MQTLGLSYRREGKMLCVFLHDSSMPKVKTHSLDPLDQPHSFVPLDRRHLWIFKKSDSNIRELHNPETH